MPGHLNATQLMGVVSFSAAAIASALLARGSRTARWITVVYALLVVELFANLRFRIAPLVFRWLPAGEYAERRSLQWPALGAVLVAATALAAWLLHRAEPRERPMIAVALAAAALFAVETVSLHPIDALFYHAVAGVLAIGWAWMVLGIAAVGAAQVAGGRRRATCRSGRRSP